MPIGDPNVTIRIFIESNAAVQLKKIGTQVEQFAGKAERSTKRASRSFIRMGGILRGTTGIVQRLTGRWTAMLGTIGGTFVIFKATSDAQKFGLAMAEIGTIFAGTEQELNGAREEILRLSEAMGFVESVAAKGFYQIISANITDAADAMVILRESSELAAVGLADIKDTIDVVVTAVKAYNFDVSEAGRITDILFQTVIKGRTTIPELATSLGQVLPIAAALGVSLEEVTAAIATLTQGGIDTNVAVIQIRQALNQLLKLTPQATATLRAYGLEITTATIKQDGFAGTLFKIKEELGDNAAAYARVFGNIRALIPVLALTGDRADEFREILDANAKSIGVVGTALEKLMANPFKRFQVFLNALRLRLREVGEAFIEEFNDVLDARGGVTAVIDRLAAALEGMKPIAAAVAKTFGDFVDRIDAFINRQGGIEQASIIFQRLGAFIASAGRALASVFLNGLDIAVNLLANLPRLFEGFKNDFKRFVNDLADIWNTFVLVGDFGFDAIETPFKEVEHSSAALLTAQINDLRQQQQRVEDATALLADQAGTASSKAAAESVRIAKEELQKEIDLLEDRFANIIRGFGDISELPELEAQIETLSASFRGIEPDVDAAAEAYERFKTKFFGGELQAPFKQLGLDPTILNVGQLEEELRRLKRELPAELRSLQDELNAVLEDKPYAASLADVFSDESFLKIFSDANAALVPVLKEVRKEADALGETMRGVSDGTLLAGKEAANLGGPLSSSAKAFAESFDAVNLAIGKIPRVLKDALKKSLGDAMKLREQVGSLFSVAQTIGVEFTVEEFDDKSLEEQLAVVRQRLADATGLVVDVDFNQEASAAFLQNYEDLLDDILAMNEKVGRGTEAQLENLKKTFTLRRQIFEEDLTGKFGVDPTSEQFAAALKLFDEVEEETRRATLGFEDMGQFLRKLGGDAAPVELGIAEINERAEELRKNLRALPAEFDGFAKVVPTVVQGFADALIEAGRIKDIEELLGFTDGLQGFIDDLDIERPFEEQAAAIRRANDELREQLRLLGEKTGQDVSGGLKLINDDEVRKIRALKAELEEGLRRDPAFEFLSAVEKAQRKLLDGANALAREQTGINELTKEGTDEYKRLQAAAAGAQREALASTAAFGEGFRAQLADISRELDDMFARGAELAAGLVTSIQRSFDVGISAALKGDSDAFQQFKDALGNAIADTTAKAISDGLTNVVVGGLEGLFSGIFGGAEEQAAEVAFGLSVTAFDVAVTAFQIAVSTMTGVATPISAGQQAILPPPSLRISGPTGPVTGGGDAAQDGEILAETFAPTEALLSQGAANIASASVQFSAAGSQIPGLVTTFASAVASIVASAIAQKGAEAIPVAMGGFLSPQPASSIQSFAAGGVPERRRIQRITGGNIVRQKSLFEVGEAGQDELVVPLPGNRKVPVEMKGGGRSSPAAAPTINVSSVVNLNVTSDDRSFSQRLAQSMPEVERNITATLEQGINRALESSIRGVARGA